MIFNKSILNKIFLLALLSVVSVTQADFTKGLFSDETDILAPEQAFVIDFKRIADGSGVVSFDVQDGYYLYKDKFNFKADEQQLQVVLPEGKIKEDPLFGSVEVYLKPISILISASELRKGSKLTIQYQGCASIGVCYPPQKQEYELTKTANTVSKSVDPTAPSITANTSNIVSEQDDVLNILEKGGIWATLILFFISGLLLALTPCVFPMIPILSSIVIGQGASISTKRAFIISLVYVLAMALTYTIAGVFAGLFGENLQAALQNPYVLGLMAILFVLLALSMFGFYEIQLPSSLQSKLNAISNKQKTGSFLGVIIMGIISALIVGPCVAPPLAGALLYIGQTGDAVLGGLALFSLSMGMGVPIIVFGTTAGKYLPKAGAWMDVVKAIFGVMMLGLSLFLLERILPVWITMLLWASLFIVSAVYMGAFEQLNNRKWYALWKGIAWILLLMGIILIIGVASGGRSILQPLEKLSLNNNGNASFQQQPELFPSVYTGDSLKSTLATNIENSRPTLLFASAKWCISCKELEVTTFKNTEVIQQLAKQKTYKVDVTDNSSADKIFFKKFKIVGPPALIFLDSHGNEIKNLRVIGVISAQGLLDRIKVWQQT